MRLRRWIGVAAVMAIVGSAIASAAAPEPTVRVQRTDLSWTGIVVLDTVRGGYLVFHEGEFHDSIAVADVGVVSRTETSHVIGGVIGFLGGGASGIVLGLGVWVASSGNDPSVPLALLGASTVTGLILGAALGVPIHPTDDLVLNGLEDVQRTASLERFILDERMRAGEQR